MSETQSEAALPDPETRIRETVRQHSLLLSGVTGVAITICLLSGPVLSLPVLGLFIAIQLLSEGVTIGWMAWKRPPALVLPGSLKMVLIHGRIAGLSRCRPVAGRARL